MIQRIRRRFIRIAVTVLAAVMIVLAAAINLANWINVRSEMQETLTALAERSERTIEGNRRKNRDRHMQNTLEESRFFLVRITRRGNIVLTEASRITDLSTEELKELAQKALAGGKEAGTTDDTAAGTTDSVTAGTVTGMVDHYLYWIERDENGEGRAVFLDVETKLDGVQRLLLLSAAACAVCIGIAWLLVSLFSEKAIQPLIRNAVQQKRFITDAGHELKTPLTVISANMDALETETRGSEWIDNTRRQVSNMRDLVNDMIYLSRLDEDGTELLKENVHLSALLTETAEPFQAMADFAGKTMTIEAEEQLWVSGEAGALRKLISQLCDNAVKYAPEADRIEIKLTRAGREILLTEENGLTEPLSEEALSHLFDRFYRPDASRSRDSGGYGIGLSMARAVMEKHGGRIRAETTAEGRIRFICAFPAARHL